MTSNGKLDASLPPPPSTADVLGDAWREALGMALAQEQEQWVRERALIEAQAKATLAELRAQFIELRVALTTMVEHGVRDLTGTIAARLANLRDGIDGQPGPSGPPGPIGLKGDPGEQGASGATGERGQHGDQGPQGKQGDPGEIGPSGASGPAGERGAQGERGEAGASGAPGERGEVGPTGPDGPVGPKGDPGAPGASGAPGERGEVGPKGAPGPVGRNGDPGAPGASGAPGEHGEVGPKGDPGPVGRNGDPGAPGAAGASGAPGATGAAGQAGLPGEKGAPGERGAQGRPGMLPVAKAWRPNEVHYEGEVVHHAGSTWQAVKDTGQTPGTKDWVCLAAAGRDARSPAVRGTFAAKESYVELDIVAHNGGSFIATRDKPGPCPGDGWRSMSMPGKRGERGERGENGVRGPKGDAGAAGATLSGWKIDKERYIATPVLSDGSLGPTLELRGLFEQFTQE